MDITLKNNNYLLFQKKLKDYGVNSDVLISKYGELISNSTYGMNCETGICGDGTLLESMKKICSIMCELNKLLSDDVKIDISSIVKVAFLGQISKCVMFKKTEDSWKIKHNILYEFNPYDFSLKMGIRSIVMCSECGITLSEKEIEAIVSVDKDLTESKNGYNLGILSVIYNSALNIYNTQSRILLKEKK